MLDLFTIFSKGGIVLWCFQGTDQALTSSVNALIKSVILQERGGSSFTHEALTLKYKLDNEFELVFVVAFQKILQLSYIDKFLSDVAMEFRNKYKDVLQANVSRNFDGFTDTFTELLRQAEDDAKFKAKAPKQMRTFDQSQKSQKTVASMIENKSKPDPKSKKTNKKENKNVKKNEKPSPTKNKGQGDEKILSVSSNSTETNGGLDEETIAKNRAKLFSKLGGGSKKPEKKNGSPAAEAPKKRVKQGTKWELGGTSADAKHLDFGQSAATEIPDQPDTVDLQAVGTMAGELQDMEPESSEDEAPPEVTAPAAGQKKASGGGFSLLSNLKSLVGSKTLTHDDIESTLDKMKDHLIGKNVAADIADQLCSSVASKLEGKVLGTFNTVYSTVKSALQDSCMTLLRPHRRVDILRDAMAARDNKRPYVITFCGVNGVGKSTNLAKICFWLIENGLRVLIAACDTFRAGAVEQLRTHKRKLNALHPPEKHAGRKMVELYEKGYGKDAAGIAMEAINCARDSRFDVVLVDTAGRMQDNEPLMRALTKLIAVNQPDLVLFVGEALVGNEAVDQLTKFNQALADHSQMSNPRLIDGIVLTKFDTIDDKVGAAISMTYTTGQPIVFVGTGQTYTDLKNLNAKAVVHALLKA